MSPMVHNTTERTDNFNIHSAMGPATPMTPMTPTSSADSGIVPQLQ